MPRRPPEDQSPRPAQGRVLLEGEPADAGPFDVAAAFGRSGPLELEIGTGKGRFLLGRAAAHPDHLFLGAEIQPDYARIAQSKASRLGLTNVRVEWLEGKDFVVRRLSPGSLAALHVYFPDPWPKKRHHKRRLVEPGFASAAAAALMTGGLLRVASDHPEYWSAIERTLDQEPLLARLTPEEEGAWTTGTDYELRFLKLGKPIGKGIWKKR